MKKQNKTPLLKRKGFYIIMIVVLSLLLAADVIIGLLPTVPSGFAQGTERQQMPEMPSGMQMPEMGDMEDFPTVGRQNGSLQQRLKSIWIPVAIVLALLDGACIFLLRRLRKRTEAQNVQEEEAQMEALFSDGEVHLTRKKKRIRRHSPWWGIAPVAVILVLAMVVQLFSGTTAEKMPRTEASIHSGEAELADLDITLPGSGTLTEETAETISLVNGVEITKWYVSDGDTVTEGDALAALDRVSVMSAIATVQDTIEALDDALSDWENDTLSSKLTAPTAGRIKEIYVEAGDDVADIMYEHGALMRISMDGMMAVDIVTAAQIAAGDVVTVTLEDGAAEEGRVESITNDVAVITLTDNGPQRGDEVTVSDESGEILGSGTLYIHSELKVTAYTGTVKTVSVREEQKISSGSVLLYLKEREDIASYESLLAQRSKLEEQMAELFQLYQTSILYASCDGAVSGVEDYIAANLSAFGGAELMLLANAPGDDPDASYVNFIGKVTAVESGIWQVKLSPSSWEITDYATVAQMQIPEDYLTQTLTYTPTGAPIYARSGGAWAGISAGQVKAGDTVLFAFDPADTSRLVWIVVVPGAGDAPPAETEPDPTQPGSTEPTQPDSTESTQPDSAEPTEPSSPGQNQKPSGTGGMVGGFISGSTQPEEEIIYEVAETQILTITPQNTMQITITVDELDILSLAEGKIVQITLDAIPGQSFDGTVVQLGLLGSNSGGNSKFTAVIEIPRTAQMLPGMNASVSVMLETYTELLTVPADALVERDGKTYLYTAYDEKTDTLGSLTEVTTGLSDGQKVQILSGISEGDTYYYSYLDTVNYETSTARSTGTGISFVRMR